MTLGTTVTLNDVNGDCPVSTNVAVNNPSDSSAEYLCSLNPTQVTKIEAIHQVNKLQQNFTYKIHIAISLSMLVLIEMYGFQKRCTEK